MSDILKDLREQVAKRNAVVVVGAGVSLAASGGASVASWKGLLEHGVSRCEEVAAGLPSGWAEIRRRQLETGDVAEQISVADQVVKRLGGPESGELRRWLRETVGSLPIQERSLLEALRDLELPIATTNYDGLLEEGTGRPEVTWQKPEQMVRVLRGEEPGILHLHGFWRDADSVVLGGRSYEQVLASVPAQAVQQVLGLLRSLVFVGYGGGLEDPNFGSLLRWLRQHWSGLEHRHFRLCRDQERESLLEVHRGDRILPVPYGANYADLPAFLRELAAQRPGAKPGRLGVALATPPALSLSVAPRVFISYSQDSAEHRDRVRELADRLIREGLDCYLDQYDPHPKEPWPRWMDRQVREADWVVVVCTETYLRRANGDELPGKGLGATFESVLIFQDLYDAGMVNEKFVPVLFSENDARFIPKPLKGYSRYRVDLEEGYEALYRVLTNQPAHRKPAPGPVRKLPSSASALREVSSEPAAIAVRESPDSVPPGLLVRQPAVREKLDFDALLCHRRRDSQAVEGVARWLQAQGVKPFLGLWHLQPHTDWREEVEEVLSQTRLAVIFIGPEGVGGSLRKELQFIAREMKARRDFQLVLVLLEGGVVPKGKSLAWLYPNTQIDLRAGWSDAAALWALRNQLVHPRRAVGPESSAVLGQGEPPSAGLAEQLEQAYAELEEARLAGREESQIQRRILELKRELREDGQLKPGDLLLDGRYKLGEVIGEGGFAKVWKAWDRKLKRLVALKVLHLQYAQDLTRRERFFRGARKMAELNHPGIVRVLEQELHEGSFHIFAMEFLEGGDLRQAVTAGKLGPNQALELVIEAGEALQHAHDRGVIHRDVKPANILLDENGRPKLTDFDLVRAFDSTAGTRTAAFAGTFLYGAPEAMHNASDVGPEADVFSLAMTAAFALRGADIGPDAWFQSELFLQSLPCSPALRRVLAKGMAYRPEGRYKSVGAFCQDCQVALEGAARSRYAGPRLPEVRLEPSPGRELDIPEFRRSRRSRDWFDSIADLANHVVISSVADATTLEADSRSHLQTRGWGVVFPESIDPAPLRKALTLLLELRRSQLHSCAKPELYREFSTATGPRPGEDGLSWLQRNGVGPGPPDPTKVPGFLLLVGGPELISFDFQAQLQVQYFVGRVAFDTAEDYATYARALVEMEVSEPGHPRQITLLAPEADEATRMSSKDLVDHLSSALAAQHPTWSFRHLAGSAASKARALEALCGPTRASVVFAASHGLQLPAGDPSQLQRQGAFLTGDWPGAGKVPTEEHMIAAADLKPANGFLRSVFFLLGCFGAGTTELDDYGRLGSNTVRALAHRPFVSALGKALLSQGAIAMIGHVSRASTSSFLWQGAGPQPQTFQTVLDSLMAGEPVGVALQVLSRRYADLSSAVASIESEPASRAAVDEDQLLQLKVAMLDAKYYIVLGDPLARLKLEREESAPWTVDFDAFATPRPT